jgi:hypothetical protein
LPNDGQSLTRMGLQMREGIVDTLIALGKLNTYDFMLEKLCMIVCCETK